VPVFTSDPVPVPLVLLIVVESVVVVVEFPCPLSAQPITAKEIPAKSNSFFMFLFFVWEFLPFCATILCRSDARHGFAGRATGNPVLMLPFLPFSGVLLPW
jgi:hypothetical protein